MNIREALVKEHSKRQTMRIVNYIGGDEVRFAELMNIFLHDEYRIVQRSAWCVNYCAVRHPNMIFPYLKKMIDLLGRNNVHDAVKRNIVRMLQFIEIPRKHYGGITQACFNLLLSKDEPIAVKAFSMTVLANICKHEPDLKNELRIIINDQLPYGSSGFKNRGRKILMQLEQA